MSTSNGHNTVVVKREQIGRAANVSIPQELQPRYNADDIEAGKKKRMWMYRYPLETHSPLRLVDEHHPYSADSRTRDAWLYQVAKVNPLAWGLITSMNMRNENRGYSIVGPLSTVNATKELFQGAERGAGWRTHVGLLSSAFYCTDIGALIQAYRDGGTTTVGADNVIRPQPITSLFSYDPTKCRLTNDYRMPVEYFAPTKRGTTRVNPRKLAMLDVLRFASNRDFREEYNGLGNCFVSRSLPVIKLLTYIFCHYDELMSGRIPAGFLTVNGISQEQFETALQGHDAMMEAMGSRIFGSVAALANEGGVKVEVDFVPVSQLPVGFELKSSLEVCMMSLALNAGYPVSEFWDVSSGRGFGREGENRDGFNRAGGKGRNEFALAHQEMLQKPGVLSARVHFEYDPKEDNEKLIRAQMINAWMDAFKKAKEVGVQGDQVLRWAVEEAILPPYVTTEVEDAHATDTGKTQGTQEDEATLVQNRALQVLRRTAERLQDNPTYRASVKAGMSDSDPIVGYYSVVEGSWTHEVEAVLWHSTRDFLEGKPIVRRTLEKIK